MLSSAVLFVGVMTATLPLLPEHRSSYIILATSSAVVFDFPHPGGPSILCITFAGVPTHPMIVFTASCCDSESVLSHSFSCRWVFVMISFFPTPLIKLRSLEHSFVFFTKTSWIADLVRIAIVDCQIGVISALFKSGASNTSLSVTLAYSMVFSPCTLRVWIMVGICCLSGSLWLPSVSPSPLGQRIESSESSTGTDLHANTVEVGIVIFTPRCLSKFESHSNMASCIVLSVLFCSLRCWRSSKAHIARQKLRKIFVFW